MSCLHVSLCAICVLYPQGPEEVVECPRAGVIDHCEIKCGCWASNLRPLEERPMFLTAEPSLWPPQEPFKHSHFFSDA